MAGLAVVLIAGVAGAVVVLGLPDVADLAASMPRETRYMRLREAEKGLSWGAYRMDGVPLGHFSPLLVCAVVKSEDRRFFRHHGFDWTEIRRALSRNLALGTLVGGSTITQQTARNLYLSPEQSLARKSREAAITWEMERRLDKPRILELYLNGIEWGDGVWGAEQASRHYLGRSAADLDPFEATLLASLIAAPRQPLAGRNRVRAERVQRRILNQLSRSGLLDRSEWLDAQVRIDSLQVRLHRGMSFRDALPGPGDGVLPPGAIRRIPSSRRSVAAVVSNECGLPSELGES
jgi:monofunctional biosynthetic peptidoglycan transglycosylase